MLNFENSINNGVSRFRLKFSEKLFQLGARKFCKPLNGLCSTTTWQYSTKDKGGSTTSHWVGIERGCAGAPTANTMATHDTTGNTYNFKRGISSGKAFVRFYAASNTASKAKDNAKVIIYRFFDFIFLDFNH